ncbi:MAG: PQQ-binding-like beta-propeller repeat protein [Betaproteobacteria bacterium]|nr:PQQ-binding-like beta-propeller repeat protein [Betaproteobacteria bacterium]
MSHPRLATALLCAAALAAGASRAADGGVEPGRQAGAGHERYPQAWPMYGMNSAHAATYDEPGATAKPVAWKFGVPGAVPLAATPDDVKNRYVDVTAVRDLVGIPVGVSVVAGMVYIPSDNGHVYALNAGDGKLAWQFDALNQIMTTPIVAQTVKGALVYVGGGNADFSYSEAVKFGTPGAAVVRGTGINGIYALHAKTGEVAWTFRTQGQDMPTPVYHHGKIIFGNGDGHVYALDAAAGSLLWKTEIKSFVSMSSATLAGNLVVVAGTHPDAIYAIDADTGTLAWKAEPGNVYSSSMGDCAPASSDGIVVTQIEATTQKPGVAGSEEIGVDAATGRIVWRTMLGEGKVPPRNKDAVPMISDGVVYTGSPVTNSAYALDLRSGRVLWTRKLSRMKAAPSVEGEQVFFPVANGTIFALDRKTGGVVNAYQSGNGGFGPQNGVIVNHTMYIGTNYGWVYAIPTSELLAGKSSR